MRERIEAKPVVIDDGKPTMSVDQMLRMVMIAAIAVIVLFAGLAGALYLGYLAVLDNFGREGMRFVMTVMGTVALVVGVAYALGGIRRRDMQDLTGILKAQAIVDMARERNDDQGEILRQLAPQLLSMAKQNDASATQKAVAMFYGAMKMNKDNQPAIPDFGMTGATIDESQFVVKDED